METRWKITIEEIGEERRTRGHEWKQKDDGSDGYEYTPEIEKMVEYERRIFEQTIKSLTHSDLSRIIKAVNGME